MSPIAISCITKNCLLDQPLIQPYTNSKSIVGSHNTVVTGCLGIQKPFQGCFILTIEKMRMIVQYVPMMYLVAMVMLLLNAIVMLMVILTMAMMAIMVMMVMMMMMRMVLMLLKMIVMIMLMIVGMMIDD